jgi:anti-sigma factor RsiW
MSEDDEDARLVAYIDGELDKDERAAVEERLTTDADLRARLMRLREGERPFVAAFEALLERAPVERLQASLAEHVARQERRRTSMRDSWTLRTGVLAAAAAIILFCAGIAIGHYGPGWLAGGTEGDDEDWRQSVVEYAAFYTPETFGSEPASKAKDLALVGAKLGLPLTPERIALANLEFKDAQILNFRGAPLGEVDYLDPATGPVLFCIIRDSEPNAAMKTETRGEFAVASWARDGRGYIVIGKLPVKQIAELANSLEQRF